MKALEHQRPSGAAKLLAAALERLTPLEDGLAGLRLAPLCRGLAATQAEVQRWLAGERAGIGVEVAPRLERHGGAGHGSA